MWVGRREENRKGGEALEADREGGKETEMPPRVLARLYFYYSNTVKLRRLVSKVVYDTFFL